MVAAAGDEVAVACAPPVAARTGGSGRTEAAPLPPVLATMSDAVKVCPRLKRDGRVKDCAERTGGLTTLRRFEVAAGAVSGSPEFASEPTAPAETCNAPGPVPFSTYVQVNVCDDPPAMETAACPVGLDADAWPVASTAGIEGLGSTFVAVAPPVLAMTSVTAKDWPRSMDPIAAAGARTSEVTESTAGFCTVVVAGAAATASGTPLLTSEPAIVAAKARLPDEVLASWYVQKNVVLWPASSRDLPAVAVSRTGMAADPPAVTEGLDESCAMPWTVAPPSLVTVTETVND